MRRARTFAILATLLFGATGAAPPNSPSVTFESEHRVIVLPGARVRNIWRDARVYGAEGNRSEQPLLYRIDINGRKDNVPFGIDGQRYVDIMALAPGFDGSIAVASFTLDKSGRRSNFITRQFPGGTRTETAVWPYAAEHIALTPSGTIWAIGWIRNALDPDGPTIAKNVLKRFDAAGKEIYSAGIHGRYTAFGNTFTTAHLRASRDRVVWLSPGNEYIEWSLDGREQFRMSGPCNEHDIVSGLAIRDDNVVVASIQRNSPRRIELVLLDRKQARWVPITVTNKDRSDYWQVIGWDRDSLIFLTGEALLRYKFVGCTPFGDNSQSVPESCAPGVP